MLIKWLRKRWIEEYNKGFRAGFERGEKQTRNNYEIILDEARDRQKGLTDA